MMNPTSVLNQLLKKFCNIQFLIFIMVAIMNAAITYVMYLLLLQVLDYKLAYGTSFLMGVMITYFANCKLTFKKNVTVKHWAFVLFTYLLQLLANIYLLYLLVEGCNLNKKIAPFLVIAIIFPITYLVINQIMKRE
jgi:putative flippase GtrA